MTTQQSTTGLNREVFTSAGEKFQGLGKTPFLGPESTSRIARKFTRECGSSDQRVSTRHLRGFSPVSGATLVGNAYQQDTQKIRPSLKWVRKCDDPTAVSPKGDYASFEERRGDSESPAVKNLPEDLDKVALKHTYMVLRWHHEVHGFDFHSPEVEEKTLAHWEGLALKSGGWLKFMKYKLPAFFASWVGNVPEKAPWRGDASDDPKRLISSRSLNREFQKICLRESERRGVAVRTVDTKIRDGESREFANFRSFIVGILYVKKGLTRPSDEDVKKGVISTIEALFSPAGKGQEGSLSVNPISLPVLEEGSLEECAAEYQAYPFNRESITAEIERTVDELFRGECMTRKALEDLMFPSLRANTMASIKDCGMFGILSEDPILRDLWQSVVPRLVPFRMWQEDVGDVPGFEDRYAFSLDHHEVAELKRVTFAYCFQKLSDEDPYVLPKGLKEPLKVRVITKEPPYLMYILKPIQAWMWRVLARHPVFRLLKEPNVTDVSLSFLGKLEEGRKMLSGDYSGATNNLRGWASRAAAMALKKFMDDELVELGIFNAFVVSLVDHLFDNREVLVQKRDSADPSFKFKYPECPAPGLPKEVLPQTEGQLMGSVTSFPILCIVNAAVCRMCIERDRVSSDVWNTKPNLRLKNCQMLINGDDCVFQVGDVGYRAWLGGCALMGLIPSVGKFYYCENYLNINSTSFFRTEMRDVHTMVKDVGSVCPIPGVVQSEWSLCKYVNWGLVLGLKRADEGLAEYANKTQEWKENRGQIAIAAGLILGDMDFGTSMQIQKSLGSISHELVEFTPPELVRKVHDKFVELRVRPFFSNMNLPWFVPESYGGLGLYPYLGGMTKLDRQRCLALRGSPERFQIEAIRPFALFPVWKALQEHLKEWFGRDLYDGLCSTEDEPDFMAVSERTDEAKRFFFDVAPYWLEAEFCTQDSLENRNRMIAAFAQNRRVWRKLCRRTTLPRVGDFDPWNTSNKKREIALSWF